MKLDPKQIGWLLFTFIMGIIVGVVAITLAGRTRPAPIVIQPPLPTDTPAPTATAQPLRVFVSGAVLSPAVYELPTGTILGDVVALAGGLSAEAATERVNLAQPLADGMHIHIPTVGQEEVVPVVSGSAPAEVGGGGGSGSGKLNLNRATLAELDTLPGIGPSTAQNIIDYRQANGPFSQPADIMEVPGIGQAKFEQIQDLVTVE